jgi:hypothetical protein
MCSRLKSENFANPHGGTLQKARNLCDGDLGKFRWFRSHVPCHFGKNDPLTVGVAPSVRRKIASPIGARYGSCKTTLALASVGSAGFVAPSPAPRKIFEAFVPGGRS